MITCRMSGCSELRIVFRHIIPIFCRTFWFVQHRAVLHHHYDLSYAFLGLGLETGTAEWGAMFVNAIN
ncbi:MAG: hypothetical protein ACLSB9_31595 [Hydrogeniiclostridium mannosilyticum]